MDTAQLRNDHGGMGIVDLDAYVFVELIQVHAPLFRFFNDQLRCIAHHKILLVDTQKLSVLVAVVRIKEQGQIPVDILLVKLDSLTDDVLIHTVQIEQVQLVAAAAVFHV